MSNVPADESDSEPFELLASEIRLGIVRVLGEGMAGGEHTPLSFTELQAAVGVDDNGKFNYHLERLTGHFVEKVDRGYRLRPPGIHVFQAVKSGSYDANIEVAPTETNDPCVDCGGTTSVWYTGGRAYSGCRDCDDVSVAYPLPPGLFDVEDPEDLAEAASKRLSRDLRAFLRGVCPYCSGDVETDVVRERPEILTADASERQEVLGAFSCRRCYWFMNSSLETLFREHPAVSAFFYERGLDLRDVRQWNAPYEYDVTVREEEPLRVAVTYRRDGDARTLVVNEDLTVLAVDDD